MSVFVDFAGGRRRFVRDDSGSTHIEWTMAAALVVLAAFSIMSMVGKGSETRSGDIASTIADADFSVDILADPAPADTPADLYEKIPAAKGDRQDEETASTGFGPGAELGIGFSAGVDIRGGDYRRISARRTETSGSKLGDLRRSEPAAPAGLSVAPPRIAAAKPAAPEKAGIFLPTLPVWRANFAQNACLDPFDHGSITDARFELTVVASSDR